MNSMFFRCVSLLIPLIFLFSGCSGDTSQSSKAVNKAKSVGGRVLANDQLINTVDNLDNALPAVAYDNVSNPSRFLVVWTHTNPDNTTDIKARLFTGTGTGSTSALTPITSDIVVTNAVGNQSQPKVIFSPSTSRYLIVWTDSRNIGYSQIYGQFLSIDGGLLQTNGTAGTTADNFPVSIHNSGASPKYLSQSDPDIVYNSADGKFYVSWADVSDFDQVQPLSFTTTDPCGGTQTFNYTLAAPVVLDNLLVRYVTISPDGSSLPVNAASVNNWSRFTAGAVTKSTASYTVPYNESKPKLAYSPINGEAFLAWSGISTDVTATFSFTQSTVTLPTTPPTSSTICTKDPITFVTTPIDANTKVKFRRNQGLGVAVDYTFGGATNNTNYPAVAFNPNTNRILVAWEENQQIMGQLVDASSFAAYGPSITISSGIGPRTSPVVSYDNVNQRYLVVWEDARNQSTNFSNIDIYGQFIDPNGNLSGGNTIITTVDKNQLAPAIAFGGNLFRQFLIVWSDGRTPGHSDIYAQLLEYSVLPQLVLADSFGNPILNGAIDFGNVNIGQTKDINFKIRNDGNSTLNIPAIGSPAGTIGMSSPQAPFTFLTPIPSTINAGTSYDMTVRFAPLASGSYADTSIYNTVINSDAGKSTLLFSGAGVGSNALNISTSSFPEATLGSAYTQTLSGIGGSTPYSWSWSPLFPSVSTPPGLTLAGNVISGTPTASGTYTFTVTLSDGAATKATANFTLKVTSVTISTTALKQWTSGVDYGNGVAQVFAGSTTSGTPLTWTVTNGNLPPGITLSANGTLIGIPTQPGTFTFTVKATDGVNQSSVKDFSITINPTPAISNTTLPAGNIGTAYNQTISRNGGTSPLSWSIKTGSLPSGLVLDISAGTISGVPSSSGTSNFTIQLTDSTGKSVTQDLSITINSALMITTSTLPLATISSAYSQTLSAAGGRSPYLWSITAGALPAGLSLNVNTGMISGTPNTAGNYDFIVSVKDVDNITVSSTLSIIASSSSILTNAAITSGTGTIATISNVPANSSLLAITSKPADFNINSALDIVVNSVPSGGTITLTFDFVSLPSNPVFYKVTNGVWTKMNSTDYTLTGTKLSFSVTDNGAFDSDSRTGVIRDPIVVGSVVTGGTTPSTGGSTGSNIAPSSSSGGGGGCFIATAAYGSYLNPHVMVLRHFRDDVLMQSDLGTAFVKLYYKYSPPVADYIAHHESMRILMRFALTPLIFAVKYPLVTAALFFLGVSILVARRVSDKKHVAVQCTHSS